jgi:hypothetical protein
LAEEKQKRKLAKLRKIFLKSEKELNFSLTELIEEFRRLKNSALIAEEKLIKIGVKRLTQMKSQIIENEERVEIERKRIERVFGSPGEMEMEEEEEGEWDEQMEDDEDREGDEGDFMDEVDDDIDDFENDVFTKKLVTRKRKVVRR